MFPFAAPARADAFHTDPLPQFYVRRQGYSISDLRFYCAETAVSAGRPGLHRLNERPQTAIRPRHRQIALTWALVVSHRIAAAEVPPRAHQGSCQFNGALIRNIELRFSVTTEFNPGWHLLGLRSRALNLHALKTAQEATGSLSHGTQILGSGPTGALGGPSGDWLARNFPFPSQIRLQRPNWHSNLGTAKLTSSAWSHPISIIFFTPQEAGAFGTHSIRGFTASSARAEAFSLPLSSGSPSRFNAPPGHPASLLAGLARPEPGMTPLFSPSLLGVYPRHLRHRLYRTIRRSSATGTRFPFSPENRIPQVPPAHQFCSA